MTSPDRQPSTVATDRLRGVVTHLRQSWVGRDALLLVYVVYFPFVLVLMILGPILLTRLFGVPLLDAVRLSLVCAAVGYVLGFLVVFR